MDGSVSNSNACLKKSIYYAYACIDVCIVQVFIYNLKSKKKKKQATIHFIKIVLFLLLFRFFLLRYFSGLLHICEIL